MLTQGLAMPRVVAFDVSSLIMHIHMHGYLYLSIIHLPIAQFCPLSETPFINWRNQMWELTGSMPWNSTPWLTVWLPRHHP